MIERLITRILMACLAISSLALPVEAESPPSEIVTREEALTVANNWIALIIHLEGDWGGSEIAEVREIQEFKRGERVLGYFCSVKPQGFIVVSLRRELAPVKAYSAVSDLAPACDKGMVELLKGRMEGILDAIEEQLGPLASVPSQDLESILEINYRASWEELGVDAETFEESLKSRGVMDYQEGDVLLPTTWHQGEPYNAPCPMGNTACADCCPTDPTQICNPTLPTLVGCVATAGAQIMNYWGWPPHGAGNPSYTWDGDGSCGGNVGGQTLSVTLNDTYDWAHMANVYNWDTWQNRWEDEYGHPLTQAHLDAVAELSYEVGVAVAMDYGVCASGAWPSDMANAYEDSYFFSTDLNWQVRHEYSADDWFNLMKSQFNLNRPVQYFIPGHSIVSDGWKVELGQKQYHMNYGWGGGATAWYILDALPGGDTNEEYMLENIYPVRALGDWVSGWYNPSPFTPLNYIYFDRDAQGVDATFDVGHYVQFLSEVTVTCTSTSGGSIRFLGSSSSDDYTYLFTAGDRTRGIEIRGGHIYLYQNGSLKFHRK